MGAMDAQREMAAKAASVLGPEKPGEAHEVDVFEKDLTVRAERAAQQADFHRIECRRFSAIAEACGAALGALRLPERPDQSEEPF